MLLKDNTLKLSTLNKTWIFDFDGTLVVHNGYKTGEDRFLDGAKEFLQSIPEDDFVIIMTARETAAKDKTEKFLKENNIRYDRILFEMPMGERILINDNKPSGLKCAYALCPNRNEGFNNINIELDENL